MDKHDEDAIKAIGLGPDNAGPCIRYGDAAIYRTELSDSSLTRIEEDMTKMFGVPEDRRKGEVPYNWGTGGVNRIIHDQYSRLIQLATFLSYAVHAGNLEDAKTLAKAYDEELDRVLGRSEGDIWRG